MKNTPQIIGVPAVLTFVLLAWPPQQMFAHRPKTFHPDEFTSTPEHHSWKSVIITEIMADPSPPRGLPDVEYIELYNRTDLPIALGGWKFSDPVTTTSLAERVLESHAYLTITTKGTGFENSNVMVLGSMPSLNNSRDSLILRDSEGNEIDIVNYSDSWYGDSQRSAGGWSLELIDPDNTCEARENWTVSDDPLGGTPGKRNSVFASNPDVTPPELISVRALDTHKLRTVFSEKLAAGLPSVDQWTIEPPLHLLSSSFADSTRSAIDLHVAAPIQAGVLYKIFLTGVSDCAGNLLAKSKRLSLALPEPADKGDILLNEILFNPPPNGVDFVELFNASPRYIDLNGWAICSRREDGTLDKRSIESSLIIPPGGYLAFSPDLAVLKAHYAAPDSTLVQLRLPSYPDNSGTVVLIDASDSVMDELVYSQDMHNIFVRNAEGVSLERISALAATDASSNWTSAGASDGYATPGRRNSVNRAVSGMESRPITVTPTVFTPITGQPNFAEIFYRFDRPGYVATVNIYDNRGAMIRQLANNVTLGTEGSLRWEGNRDDGQRTQTGYYLVWFQVFDADGSSRLYREPVAVSPRY